MNISELTSKNDLFNLMWNNETKNRFTKTVELYTNKVLLDKVIKMNNDLSLEQIAVLKEVKNRFQSDKIDEFKLQFIIALGKIESITKEALNDIL